MKKLLLFSVIIFSGCIETFDEKFDRFMSELTCPVILIGKTEPTTDYPSVIVRDAKGLVRTFHSSSGLPEAISQSRLVGDTLKPCN